MPIVANYIPFMADISFYHLTSTTLDQALPKLLEKAIQGGFRVVMRTASDAESERLASLLWTYDPDSFLPHGTAKDGYSELQPIYITAGDENPNNANLLLLTHAMQLEEIPFERVLDVFNGLDEEQVASARARWKHYKEASHTLSYIKQTTSGGWEKQAL